MKRRFLNVWIAVVSVLFLCVANLKLNVFAEELTGMEDNSAGSGEAVEIPDLYGIVDTEAPVVKGIELSKTEVEAPGTLEVTADVYDEVSGVSYVNIKFEDKETQKMVSCTLSKEYHDENYNWVEYEDGKWHGELQIDQYLPSGKFMVYDVYVNDNAGNSKYYYADIRSTVDNRLPEDLWNIGFEVKNENIVDTQAPVVKGIELTKTEVEVPGTVEVIADIYDEVSGVSYVNIKFEDKETQKMVSCTLSREYHDENYNWVEYEDGKWHGELQIDQYLPSGKFMVYDVYVNDNAGNSKYYYANKSSTVDNRLPEDLWNIGFEVKNENIVDTQAPVVKGIELTKTEVEAPGTVEVIADIYDEVSGVSYVNIKFEDKETQKMVSCTLSKEYHDENYNRVEYEDGKWHGELQIDQYLPSGKFMVYDVYVNDNAGNSKYYYADIRSTVDNRLPEELWDLGFSVFNDDMGAVILSGTTNPNLVDDIKNASEDAVIAIDYTQNSNLNKDVFDAIAGTDKKIALLSEGVQWEFNGKDIVNDIKEIDLKVNVSPLPQVNTQTGSEIEQITKEQPSVVLHFPENGVLPGKAKIRVKADYSLRKYLGEEGLCVYYYDNTNKVFVPIASDLKITSDYYIEFEIEHCSDYVVTKGAVSDLSGTPDSGTTPDNGTEPGTEANPDDEKQPDNGTVSDDNAEQEEEEDEQEEENTANAVNVAVAPNTGDETLLGLYLFLMAASAAGMLLIRYRRKADSIVE